MWPFAHIIAHVVLPHPAGSLLVVDGTKERNAGGQGGWRGRSCSTDQLQHLVMAEQLQETVALFVAEDPHCYLEYKLRDD